MLCPKLKIHLSIPLSLHVVHHLLDLYTNINVKEIICGFRRSYILELYLRKTTPLPIISVRPFRFGKCGLLNPAGGNLTVVTRLQGVFDSCCGQSIFKCVVNGFGTLDILWRALSPVLVLMLSQANQFLLTVQLNAQTQD